MAKKRGLLDDLAEGASTPPVVSRFKGQPESARFVKALNRALNELGPVRTLELVGDEFLQQDVPMEHETVTVHGPTPYNRAVTHIANAMAEFMGPAERIKLSADKGGFKGEAADGAIKLD